MTTHERVEKRTHIDMTIRKVPMSLYLEIMRHAAEYGTSQNKVILSALGEEFLGETARGFLDEISDDLKSAIQGYADAVGISLKDQIIKDLSEMYGS
jgi:hypothetical protein